MSNSTERRQWDGARTEQRRLKAESMLAVAGRLFEERGFADTSLSDIGAELGITNNAIYHYFSSKEELAYQCVVRIQERILAAIASANNSPDSGYEALREFGRRILDNAAKNPPLSIRLTHALAHEHRVTVATSGEQIRDGLVSLVERGQDDGSIRSGTPVLIIEFVLAGLLAMHRQYQKGYVAGGIEDALDMLLGGIAAKDAIPG